jgi:hypothetical protein
VWGLQPCKFGTLDLLLIHVQINEVELSFYEF